MQEDLLHFIWRFQLLDQNALFTKDGSKVQVLKPGYPHHDAGPDFRNARVRIGETLWAGNVEIHLKTSDWYQHQHHRDEAYGNVILHVVYQDDDGRTNTNLPAIPAPILELKPFLSSDLLGNYQELKENEAWIPCAHQIHRVTNFTVKNWLNRVLIERIAEKTDYLKTLWKNNNQDWRETFYQLLARNFGFKVNAEPFEQLAKSLPLKVIAKHKDQLQQVEALLFGQAGLLEEAFEDDYPLTLQKEYRFLKDKYGLTPLNKHQWNFLRLRPANFPTIRIAQFAHLLHRSHHLFHKIFEIDDPALLKKLFQVKASVYWDNHFKFEQIASKKQKKRLGEKGIENFLVNTVAPFLFAYGKMKGQEQFQDRAIGLLENLPPEQNSILNQWESLNIPNQNAAHSQALLYLKKQYCDKKKCLNCNIGVQILSAY